MCKHLSKIYINARHSLSIVHVQEELSLLQVMIIKQVGEMKKYGTEIFGTEKYGIEDFLKERKRKKLHR